eukprot:Nitzschia sp. Nitz4//scaffold18_size181773//166883//169362//NITZ4_001943-RA/size181773-augustus-gene-0.182-mRNA-1//-1//CDS//3329540095//4907//frame0
MSAEDALAKIKKRLKAVVDKPENQFCCDCNDKRPTWASIMVPPPGVPPEHAEPIGAFCCFHCSGAHRRLGVHICFVRSVTLDEWKEKEVLAMELGGNDRINDAFEAKLTSKEAAKIKPNAHSDLEVRNSFIRAKYNERKYLDPKMYAIGASEVVCSSPVASTHDFFQGMSTENFFSPSKTALFEGMSQENLFSKSKDDLVQAFLGDNQNDYDDDDDGLSFGKNKSSTPMKGKRPGQGMSRIDTLDGDRKGTGFMQVSQDDDPFGMDDKLGQDETFQTLNDDDFNNRPKVSSKKDALGSSSHRRRGKHSRSSEASLFRTEATKCSKGPMPQSLRSTPRGARDELSSQSAHTSAMRSYRRQGSSEMRRGPPPVDRMRESTRPAFARGLRRSMSSSALEGSCAAATAAVLDMMDKPTTRVAGNPRPRRRSNSPLSERNQIGTAEPPRPKSSRRRNMSSGIGTTSNACSSDEEDYEYTNLSKSDHGSRSRRRRGDPPRSGRRYAASSDDAGNNTDLSKSEQGVRSRRRRGTASSSEDEEGFADLSRSDQGNRAGRRRDSPRLRRAPSMSDDEGNNTDISKSDQGIRTSRRRRDSPRARRTASSSEDEEDFADLSKGDQGTRVGRRRNSNEQQDGTKDSSSRPRTTRGVRPPRSPMRDSSHNHRSQSARRKTTTRPVAATTAIAPPPAAAATELQVQ